MIFEPHRNRVLNFDSDPQARQTPSQWLRSAGYEVTMVETAQELPALIAHYQPFALILSSRLPGSSALCRQLKHHGAITHCSILLLAAEHDPDGLAIDEIDGYLREPVTETELLSAVRLLQRFTQSEHERAQLQRERDDLTTLQRELQVQQAILHEHELRFRTLVETIGDVFWISDWESKKLIYVSPAYAEIWGRDMQALYDHFETWMEAIHDDDRERVRAHYYRDIQTGTYDEEYRVVRPDGSIRWIHDRGKLLGKGTLVAGVAEDISVRKQAEAQLHENEQRFRAFLENSAVIGWLKDEDGRHVFLSENYQRRFGVRLADWRGKTDFELWPREIAEEFHRNDQAVLATDAPIEVVEHTTDTTGNKTWWLNNKFTYSDMAGRRYVGGLGVDITERRRVEADLQERHRQFSLLARTSQRLLLGQAPERELLETVFSDIGELLGMEMFYHYRPAEEPRMLRLDIFGGITEEEQHNFATMHFGELLCGRVAETRARLIIEDLQHCTQAGSDVLAAAGATSYAGFPLVAGNELLGTIAFVSRHRTAFREDELQTIQTICDQVAMTLDRRRLLQELRASEERLKRVIETDAVGVLFFDKATGTLIGANEVFLNMTGYSREEVDSRTLCWRWLTPPEWVDISEQQLALLEETGRIGPYEKEYFLKNGSRAWMLFAGRDLGDGTSVEFAIDINDRKRIEMALRESEQQLRLALEAAKAGTWKAVPDTGEFTASERALALHGLPPDTSMDHARALAVVHPDDRSRVEAALTRTIETHVPFQVELRVPQPDGSIRWVASYAELQADKRPPNLIGLVQDITERKQAEVALAEQKRLLQSITDNANTALFIMDERQQCVFMNPAAEALTGYTIAETYGKPLHDVVHHTRPDGSPYPRAECPIDQAFPNNDREQGEEIFVHKDGHFYPVAFTASPQRNENGESIGTIIEVQDITRRKQAEQDLWRQTEELKHINSELARSNAELDAFTYSASHDLKEPLRGIHNYAHFLLEDEAPRLSESGQQQLATIQRLTQRMQQLIDCLAEYSRVGRMELDLQPIDLMEVLNQVMEILQPRIVERAVALRLPATWPTIRADRVLISQVFQNLVSNAIKYSDSAEPWVEVGYTSGDPSVFYVRDNGIGIKPQHLEQVFQIFRRLHGHDAYGGGTGAGLTITKKIIERHGGKIWVESTPGEGSAFYFTLNPQSSLSH